VTGGAQTACKADSLATEGGVIGGAPLFLSIWGDRLGAQFLGTCAASTRGDLVHLDSVHEGTGKALGHLAFDART
jgi:hypothetical protein